MTYTLTTTGGGVPSTIFTLTNPTTTTFLATVNTALNTDISTYYLRIKANANTPYTQTAQRDFTVTVTGSACLAATVTAPTLSSATYYRGASSGTYTFPAFTVTPTFCGPNTYSA